MHIMTLAPEQDCFWNKGISYIFGDLRDTMIRDSYYDKIICGSTLEHIGCDNSFYTGKKVNEPEEETTIGITSAVKEMHRILKPGGCLMITVPFGIYQHLNTMQQFDSKLLSRVIETFGPYDSKKITFIKYNMKGWEVSSLEECANSHYVEWVASLPFPYTVPVEKDKAAAARAVACIMLVKPYIK
jgi:hypothetical protein